MSITNVTSQLLNIQQNREISSPVGGSGQPQKSADTSGYDTAVSSPRPAVIASPLVSDAVQSALVRLQETGSVFDVKDRQLMNVRGVSDQDQTRFAEIVQSASQTGGYDDPVNFIQSLSTKDVEVLRRVHSLAEPSGVTNTDREGAINLLLPRRDHVDINNDGLVKTGAATGFYFPPPNSPQSVKDAWEVTTMGMSLKETLLAQTPFMAASIGANVKVDESGTPIGIYEHTDPEYKNVFGTSESEWDGFLKNLIAQYKEGMKREPGLAERVQLLSDFAGNISNGERATT